MADFIGFLLQLEKKPFEIDVLSQLKFRELPISFYHFKPLQFYFKNNTNDKT